MKNLRLFAVLGSSVFFASAGLLVACSDDDNVVTVTPPDGGGTDGTTADRNVPDDDSGGGKDASNDNNVDTDAGLKLDTWATTVGEKLCDVLTKCCFGQTNVADGGALDGGGNFDRFKCVQTSGELGFEGSLIDNDAITKGKVTLDQVKGKDCLDKIAALPCNLTGAQLKTTRAACFGALTGTVANGQDCRSSLECVPGHFCLPNSLDAGTPDGGNAGSVVIGKCAPLRGSGGNCSIRETGAPGSNEEIDDSLKSEEACSYRGSADTNLRCDSYDFVGGAYRARADWKCTTQVANGQGCNSTQWCTDGICDSTQNYICASPAAAFSPASCDGVKQ